KNNIPSLMIHKLGTLLGHDEGGAYYSKESMSPGQYTLWCVISNVWYYLICLMAAAGCVRLWKTDRCDSMMMIPLCIIGIILAQLMFEVAARYHYCLIPMLILLAAIAITVLYVQSTNAQVELKNVKKSISRLIMLQNQVKVRYVNNTNLLDYLRMKYRVMSSSELTELYNKYLRERKEREKIEDARRLLDSNQKDLIYMLRHFRVRDPEIWIHQAEALLSHNEEVEIRHSLNVRRQSLRKRMEYNKDIVAGNAKNEVEDMARQYPEYAQEILDMVSKYEDRE
ncbi:MAG: hypothetical protein II586_00680, partial [Butyrivibrio sp.]|nr:hypothetical protein [Butyrivibrio sp.]